MLRFIVTLALAAAVASPALYILVRMAADVHGALKLVGM